MKAGFIILIFVSLIASGVVGGIVTAYFQAEAMSVTEFQKVIGSLEEVNRRQDKVLEELRTRSPDVPPDGSVANDMRRRLEMIEQEQIKLSLLVGHSLESSSNDFPEGAASTAAEAAVSSAELSHHLEKSLDQKDKQELLKGNNPFAGFSAGREKILKWLSEDLGLDGRQKEMLVSEIDRWQKYRIEKNSQFIKEVYGDPPDYQDSEKKKRFNELYRDLEKRQVADLDGRLQ